MPLTLKQTLFVMSDLLVAMLCLLAAAAWAAYLQRPGYKRALGFGLLAAAAILTKGSALALCLVPPVATLLSGRWRLMLTPSLVAGRRAGGRARRNHGCYIPRASQRRA